MKSRIRKKILVVSLSMSMIAGLAGYGAPEAKAAVRLNRTKAAMYVGGKVKLTVKGTAKKVKWSTSRKKVATVSTKGLVKGKSKGSAKIYARTGSKKLICRVTVKEKKAVEYTATKIPVTAAPVIPTAAPVQQPTAVPTQNPVPTAVVTMAPTIAPTTAPTDTPEPTEVPAYMAEGAFVYEKLDISWIDPEKPMVAFTFDDGPVGTADTDSSMRILAALKEYGMHATFNYITSRINANTKGEILQAMEQGCEIGNHTTGYDSLSSFTSDKIEADVEAARKALEEITGISSFTLRPPNLALNDDVYHAVNVPMIGCNVYSLDWEGKSTEDIIKNVENAKDGDIVLMHETYTTTAEAVEHLVPYFVEKGFQIVSVSELYAVKDIPMFPENYYNCTTKDPTKPSK